MKILEGRDWSISDPEEVDNDNTKLWIPKSEKTFHDRIVAYLVNSDNFTLYKNRGKNSRNFVYVQAAQYRTSFILTGFFDFPYFDLKTSISS